MSINLPHFIGDEGPDGYCEDCLRGCSGIWEDHGIGSYEFWGAPGNDVRMEYVSHCCSAGIVDASNNPVDPPDVYEEEP